MTWIMLVLRLIFLGCIVHMLRNGLNEIQPFLPPKLFSGLVTVLIGLMFYIWACSERSK